MLCCLLGVVLHTMPLYCLSALAGMIRLPGTARLQSRRPMLACLIGWLLGAACLPLAHSLSRQAVCLSPALPYCAVLQVLRVLCIGAVLRRLQLHELPQQQGA